MKGYCSLPDPVEDSNPGGTTEPDVFPEQTGGPINWPWDWFGGGDVSTPQTAPPTPGYNEPVVIDDSGMYPGANTGGGGLVTAGSGGTFNHDDNGMFTGNTGILQVGPTSHVIPNSQLEGNNWSDQFRTLSTPYADSYIRATQQAKKSGPVSKMFRDVLGEDF